MSAGGAPSVQSAASDGLVDTSFAPAIPNGSVDAILPLADGSVIIGGDFDFTRSDGTVQHGLAKLTPAGAFDPTFAPGAGVSSGSGPAAVTTLALQPDGRIVVGGSFDHIAGVAKSNLARVDATGSVDASFTASGITTAPSQLTALADGRVLVAQHTNTLVWLNSTGAVAQTSVGATIFGAPFLIDTFDVASDGTVAAAGSTESGWARTGVVEFNADGTFGGVLGSRLTLGVRAYATRVLADGSIVVAFDGVRYEGSLYGPPGFSIYRYDPNNGGSVQTALSVYPPDNLVAYIQSDGRVVVAANSTLGRYQTDGTRDPTFLVQGVTGTVDAIVGAADGGVYVGGDFNAIDNTPQPKLAKLHASSVNPNPPSLINVSARAFVDGGDRVLIAGFVTDGTKSVILRGVGPTLAQYGISDPLADPQLTVYDANQAIIGQNDNWGDNAGDTSALQIGFTLPNGSKDAALQTSVAPGVHTLVVRGGSGSSGVGVAEVYQVLATPTAKLINLSARGYVGTGDEVLIAGFIVQGSGTGHFLIRALGPDLGNFGVSAPLARPLLTVYDAQHHVVATNTGWANAPDPALLLAVAAEVGAVPLPNSSADSAVLLELPAGTYTATVSGADGGTGIATAEVYEVP